MRDDFMWNGKLPVQDSEQWLFTLIRINETMVSVSVSDGNNYWYGQGDENSIATAVKVSKNRLEIIADTLQQSPQDTSMVLTKGGAGTKDTFYLKVLRLVYSDLPMAIVCIELKSQVSAVEFLETVWDVLTMYRCRNEELENRVRREEAVNEELQRVLDWTREEKNSIEKKLLYKFMLLLNEKKRKIQWLTTATQEEMSP
jgi:hypothetical protein